MKLLLLAGPFDGYEIDNVSEVTCPSCLKKLKEQEKVEA